MLQALGVDVIHLRESGLPQNTKDVDWIPFAASKGYIAVTSDVNMSRIPVEVAALAQSGLIVFYLPDGFASLDLFIQAEKLCKAWKSIEAFAANARPGDAFQVSLKNGKVEKRSFGRPKKRK